MGVPPEIAQQWPIIAFLLTIIIGGSGWAARYLLSEKARLEAALDREREAHNKTRSESTAALLAASERVYTSLDTLREVRQDARGRK